MKQVEADAEDAEVTAVAAVDEMAVAGFDGLGAEGNEPGVEQRHGESEAGEALPVAEAGALEVKAMALEVTEHLLNPHAAAVVAAGCGCGG